MDLFATAKAHLAPVKTYTPGKPLEELERDLGIKNAVKMASNENALGPSPKAVAAIKRTLSRLHRYPEGGCHYLRARLAKHHKVRPDELVFGNGSDEILIFAVRSLVGSGDEVIIADPTFLIYEIASRVENGTVIKVPMKYFHYDLDAMRAKITPRTRLVFIANPDNPVGTYVTEKALRDFMRFVPRHVVVVVDEAYYEFARERKDYPDTIRLLREHSNLIITRTFSKAYGLAGLRVGYAVTTPQLAATLNKVREPFNVNLLAQAGALAALDDQKHLKRSVRAVQEGRKYLYKELKALGFAYVDTATNFILFDTRGDASVLYDALLRQGVIVRPMSGWGLKNFLRVTIGTKKENARFVGALKKALKAKR